MLSKALCSNLRNPSSSSSQFTGLLSHDGVRNQSASLLPHLPVDKVCALEAGQFSFRSLASVEHYAVSLVPDTVVVLDHIRSSLWSFCYNNSRPQFFVVLIPEEYILSGVKLWQKFGIFVL